MNFADGGVVGNELMRRRSLMRQSCPFRNTLKRTLVARSFSLFTTLSFLVIFPPAFSQPTLPSLNIAAPNDAVTVSWPLTGYYFILQSATDMSPSATWTNLFTGSKIVASMVSENPDGPAGVATNSMGLEFVTQFGMTNEQQFFRLKSPPPIPVFQFAIFYDGLLEFSSTADLTINGLVHANGPVFVGAGTNSALIFGDAVSSCGTLFAPANNSQNWGDPYTYSENWRTTFNGYPSYITNVPAIGLPIPTNNLHAIIEIPPPGENVQSELWKARLFNQAQIVLLVSNASVTLGVRSYSSTTEPQFIPGNDPSPVLLTYSHAAARTNLPFLTLTNTFHDKREFRKNRVTELNIGRYATWIKTNSFVLMKHPVESGSYPTILYVGDYRTNSPGFMSAVRLTNGLALPINGGLGFTLVTPNPLYVWGNYNCTNPSAYQSPDTSYSVPAALIADAVTILSTNWSDATSFLSFSVNASYWRATNTTVNAAILAGIVPTKSSSSGNFSGGVQNFPRLLENWYGATLWLNTSIVCLYNSKEATNRFVGPWVYYAPPARRFLWDTNFLNAAKLPPGTPYVGVLPSAD